MSTKTSSGGSGLQVPILAFLAGTLLLVSALRGQSIVDILAGTEHDPLSPSGVKRKEREAGAAPAPGGTVDSTGGPKASGAIKGSPIAGQSPHSATHQTSGLPGFPAYDYMAPAGTPCLAPVDGKIGRLSGKSPKLGGKSGGALGYSIYLTGSDGKSYYMTHLDRVTVRVGQRVKQGEQIAEVANGPASWSTPHVHMGVRG